MAGTRIRHSLLAALLLTVTTVLSSAGPASAAPPVGTSAVTQNGITVSGAATPGRVHPGEKTALSATVRSDIDRSGVIDIQVFNTAGQQVYRRYFVDENLHANTWLRRSAPWNATLIGGVYRVQVNVFDSAWTLLATDEQAATLTVTSTRTPAPVVNGVDPAGGQPLRVSGNRIVTPAGKPFRLLGVNRSGGEFACIQGWGFWSGDTDQASVDALKSWNVHSVRIPLNEECWIGTANVAADYAGVNYRNAVRAYVDLLLANQITPILEMHWSYGLYTGPSSGCADVHATCQKPMPDAQYAPTFWRQVARAFNDNRIVFEPFNEPYPDRVAGSDTWRCWRDGGTCPGIGYRVAGMQTLVNAIRGTGNRNVILLGGVAYDNDLSAWLAYEPRDPLGNLAAAAHIYNFNGCKDDVCFDNQLAQVAARVPLTFTEIGQNADDIDFVTSLFPWADAHGAGYLGWTWNTWDDLCLVRDEAGTPTDAGANLRTHLLTQ